MNNFFTQRKPLGLGVSMSLQSTGTNPTNSFFTQRKPIERKPIGSGMSSYGFANRLGPMSQYKTSHNPRTDGTMNVTDAINDGQTVMPWLPSSGVGPSSEGYRGSYDSGFSRRGYGHGGGGREGFHTGRPTARTADEFYKARDLTIGNPIEELKMHGPNRDAFVQRAYAEAGVGGVAGAVQGTDAYYAGKGLGPDGKTPLEVAPIDAGFGTMMKGGKQVPMTQADFANVKRQSFVKSSFNPTEGTDFEAVAQPYQPYTPEPYVYTPQGEDENANGPRGHTTFENDDGAARMERRRRDEERAKVDEEMSRGTFTPGTAGGSSFSGSQFFPTAQVGNFFKRTLPKLLPGAFGR